MDECKDMLDIIESIDHPKPQVIESDSDTDEELSLQEQLDLMTLEMEEKDKQFEAMRKTMMQYQSAFEQLNNAVEFHKNKTATLQDQLTKKQLEVASLKVLAGDAESVHQDEELLNKIANTLNLHNEIDKTATELAANRDKVAEMGNQLQQKNAYISNLEVQMNKFKLEARMLKKKDTELAQLKSTLLKQGLNKLVESLSSVKDIDTQIEELTDKLNAATSELHEVKQQLQQQVLINDTLQSKLKDAVTARTPHDKTLKMSNLENNTVQELKDQLAAERRESSCNKQRMQGLLEEVVNLRNALEQARTLGTAERVNQLENEVEIYRNQEALHAKRLSHAEELLRSAEGQCLDSVKQRDEVLKQNEALKSSIVDLTEQVKRHSVGKDIQEKEREITLLQVALQNKEKIIKTMSQNSGYVQHLEGKTASLEKKIVLLKDIIANMNMGYSEKVSAVEQIEDASSNSARNLSLGTKQSFRVCS